MICHGIENSKIDRYVVSNWYESNKIANNYGNGNNRSRNAKIAKTQWQ
jgi:hypothetical protein